MTEASARTPAAVAWPEQMITQAEAFALAATWPVYAANMITWPGGPTDATGRQVAGTPQFGEILLFCGHVDGDGIKCDRSMGQLRHGGKPYNGSLDEMLSMVLRHMVMVHDVSLAGLRKRDNPPPDGSTPDG